MVGVAVEMGVVWVMGVAIEMGVGGGMGVVVGRGVVWWRGGVSGRGEQGGGRRMTSKIPVGCAGEAGAGQ